MVALLCFFLTLFASPFKSKGRLEAENATLRHQLIVLQRKVRGRVHLTNGDRLFLVQLYRWFPSVLRAILIIRPATLVRWHRAGFRRYWRWKSRSLGGRPRIAADLRALIRRMSAENPLWRAPGTRHRGAARPVRPRRRGDRMTAMLERRDVNAGRLAAARRSRRPPSADATARSHCVLPAAPPARAPARRRLSAASSGAAQR